MKKLILMLVVATMSMTAFAQGQFRRMEPKEQATRRADQLKETCGINEEQYKKVYDFYLKQAQEMDSIFQAMQNGGGGQPQFDRDAFQKRQEAQTATMKSILTEEQFEKYQKAEGERRNRFGGGGGRPRRQQ